MAIKASAGAIANSSPPENDDGRYPEQPYNRGKAAPVGEYRLEEAELADGQGRVLPPNGRSYEGYARLNLARSPCPPLAIIPASAGEHIVTGHSE